ncbi:kinase-like domain-containing protein [Chaetomium sp. MPI-SDFR-AT-0129]|nr:kinase-like domain-containing protein [Chaetomium sp. MPI-SDFR-AT-0129]
MWWNSEAIENMVTRQFVSNRLNSQAVNRLDQRPDFGDDLTDSTYWEWIDEKARKLFLILADLGIPNRIFDVIDNSLEDEDLPFALDEVWRLRLSSSRSERVDKKFYYRQFHYLLRELENGTHIDYEDHEVVPLEVVSKKSPVTQGQHVDQVTVATQPEMLFCRCRIRLGEEHTSDGEFMDDIESIKDIRNEHIMSYWASYTHKGYGYVLFTPPPEFSLKTLLTTMPGCLKKLEKQAQRQVVLSWIYCLAETVCFFHGRGRAHGNIRPSTVTFSKDNFVFLTGFTPFHITHLSGTTESPPFDREAYDYAAPEKVFALPSSSPGTLHHWLDNGDNDVHASPFNPQAADVYSLGCVILELVSFLFKKQGRPFAAHRSAKHRAAGRGGPFSDASFHENVIQIESWMAELSQEASKKDEPLFKGISPLLHVVEGMLAFFPHERITVYEVRDKIRQILVESCGIVEPHCLRPGLQWDVGLAGPRMRSDSEMSGASSGIRSFSTATTKRGSGSTDGDPKRMSAGTSIGSGTSSRGSDGGKEAARPRTASRVNHDSRTAAQLKMIALAQVCRAV